MSRWIRLAAVSAVLVSWLVLGATPIALADEPTLSRVARLADQAGQATGAQRDSLVNQALQNLDADPALRDSEWLHEPLRARPPQLNDERARVVAAIDLLQAASPVVPADEAQEKLTAALADARFHPRTWMESVPAILLPVALIVDLVARTLWSVIRWPFDRIGDLLRGFMMSPVFGPLMAVAALAIGAGIVVLYRRGLGAILVRQAESEMVKAAAPVTAAEALAEAAKQDALARYREACHFLLLATLLWIEEKGLARFNRSATNREHLTQLASVAEVPDRRLVVALEPAIARFDRVWYGQAFVSHADYRDLLTLAGRVRDSLA